MGGAKETIRSRLFEGVGHTIFFEWRTRYVWNGAHDIFRSGAHDILWSGVPLATAQRVTHNVAKTIDHLRNAQRATGELLRTPRGGFDMTEMCGEMVRNFMGAGSPMFCLTE